MSFMGLIFAGKWKDNKQSAQKLTKEYEKTQRIKGGIQMAKKMISIYYLTEDGTQFETEEECLKYEEKCGIKVEAEAEAKRTIRDLHRMELDDLMPLEISGFFTDAKYLWYELASEEDCKILAETCSDAARFLAISEYPAMVCLEIKDTDENGNRFSIYRLSECMQRAKEFFAWFGYDCDIQNVAEGRSIAVDSMDPVVIFNTTKVLEIVDEALKKYSSMVINVRQKDGMLMVTLSYYGRSYYGRPNCNYDIFASDIARYEDCDIPTLEKELDKRNVKYYW